MKILLGGVPFGCDNIGDEAILASVVQTLREALPEAELTVATADPSTATLLQVKTVPAFGFAGCPWEGFGAVVSQYDTYIWCGATGLSDYPNVALDLLEAAQNQGIATFIWGVGMDDELNPVFFRVHGKRRMLLSAFGLVNWYEGRLRRKLSRRIAAILPRCKGIWLRDEQSVRVLSSLGYSSAKKAADTAAFLRVPQEVLSQSRNDKKVGLCISTQRQVADLEGVREMLEVLRAQGCQVVGIPMNPKTDRELLERLGVECIPGTTPAAVMETAASCRVVLSSRLHLLILAASVGTQGLGIARGSKLDNWLANFGQKTEGSVYDCDWKQVTARLLEVLQQDPTTWQQTRNDAFQRLTARFQRARTELVDALQHLQ